MSKFIERFIELAEKTPVKTGNSKDNRKCKICNHIRFDHILVGPKHDVEICGVCMLAKEKHIHAFKE